MTVLTLAYHRVSSANKVKTYYPPAAALPTEGSRAWEALQQRDFLSLYNITLNSSAIKANVFEGAFGCQVVQQVERVNERAGTTYLSASRDDTDYRPVSGVIHFNACLQPLAAQAPLYAYQDHFVKPEFVENGAMMVVNPRGQSFRHYSSDILYTKDAAAIALAYPKQEKLFTNSYLFL